MVAGQASWPNIQSTFKNNHLAGPNNALYVRGRGISISGNTMHTSGAQLMIDYDGTADCGGRGCATQSVTIGENHWLGNANVRVGTNSSLIQSVFISPQSYTGTITLSGISYAQYLGGIFGTLTNTVATNLPTGTDLNTITACGMYEGNSFVNGPSVSPSNAWLAVQVVCSGARGTSYRHQIAWQETSTGQAFIWFGRTLDGGTWGAWAQLPGTMVAPGCAQYPCSIGKLAPATYSGTAGVPATTLVTTPSAGAYRICGFIRLTAQGTAGTFALNFSGANSDGTNSSIVGTFGGATVTTTARIGTLVQGCVYPYLDAGQTIQYSVVASGVTGSPTMRYWMTAKKME